MNMKKCAAVFLVPMMLVSLSTHAGMVRVEFVGQVDFINKNSLLPGLARGARVTGYYDIDTNVAPADLNNDPNIGEYSVYAPTPITFINATVDIGGMSFQSKDFAHTGTNSVNVQDDLGTSHEDSYDVAVQSADSPNRHFQLDVFTHHSDSDPQDFVIGMLTGDSIEQDFVWDHRTKQLIPDTGFGFFFYSENDTTAIQLSFGITTFKVISTPAPPPPPTDSVFMPWLPLLLE